MSTQLHTRWSARAGLVAVATVAAVAGSLVAPSNPAVVRAVEDNACTAAYPVDKIDAGMPVTGLTVSEGTSPEQFSGTVLGVLHDGIAPGIDMIVARLSSPAIDEAGGVWAGMSGSPVYAEDGSLVGAVSYGLSYGASPVAGLTPAAAMQAWLDAPPTTVARRAQAVVDVPPRIARRIVQSGAAAPDAVTGGLSQLPTPITISGLGSKRRLHQVAKLMGFRGDIVLAGGSTTRATPTEDIIPGGNLAVTLSYGAITVGGVGTTTQVCGDEVLGFGHPAFWGGPTSLTMHGGTVVAVQSDPFYPYKLANIAGPSGAIVDDRLAAVHGYLGELPDTTVVTEHSRSSEGLTYEGTSYVTLQRELPYVAVSHAVAIMDRTFDGYGPGSSRLRMTVEGLRADGSRFEMSRVDAYESQYDITWDTVWESYEQLGMIVSNRFEDATITDVAFRAYVDRDRRLFKVGALQRRVAGQWVTIDPTKPVRVHPGQRLAIRVRLVSEARDPACTEVLTVTIPRGTAGERARLSVEGGNSIYPRNRHTSFNDLLSDIESAVHNNDLVRTLRIERPGADQVSRVRTRFSDVVGGAREITLRITR